jgi:hypothetical protein
MTEREKLIEAMAKAIHDADWGDNAWLAASLMERYESELRATATLAAIEAMGAVVVPVEATEGMERAGGLALHKCSGAFGSAGACYAAMLSASPYAKEPS